MAATARLAAATGLGLDDLSDLDALCRRASG